MTNQPPALLRRYWVFAAPLIVMLCTAGIVVTSPKPRALGEVLPVPGSSLSPLHAYVFFQPADCSANLEFLRVLARPRFRSTVAVTGMISRGTDAGEKAISARRFRDLTGRGVVRSSSREVDAAMVALGYHKTPFIVVLDLHGQVRFAAEVPTSYEASRGFERQLAELTRAPAVGTGES
jgi:hypothetical protein